MRTPGPSQDPSSAPTWAELLERRFRNRHPWPADELLGLLEALAAERDLVSTKQPSRLRPLDPRFLKVWSTRPPRIEVLDDPDHEVGERPPPPSEGATQLSDVRRRWDFVAGEGPHGGTTAEVFSLGVLAFESLTLSRAWIAPVARPDYGPRPQPSTVDPTLTPLDTVIERATDLNPRARYGTASEMVAALREACLQAGLLERPRPTSRRTLLFLAALGATVLFGGGWLVGTLLQPPEPAPLGETTQPEPTHPESQPPLHENPRAMPKAVAPGPKVTASEAWAPPSQRPAPTVDAHVPKRRSTRRRRPPPPAPKSTPKPDPLLIAIARLRAHPTDLGALRAAARRVERADIGATSKMEMRNAALLGNGGAFLDAWDRRKRASAP